MKFKANQSEIKNSVFVPTRARETNVRNKEETLKQHSPKFSFDLGGGAIEVSNQDGGETEATCGSEDLVKLSVVDSFCSMPCMEIRRKDDNRNFTKPMNRRNPIVALHSSSLGRPTRSFEATLKVGSHGRNGPTLGAVVCS